MISAGNEVRQDTGVDNNVEVVNIMISADGPGNAVDSPH